MAIEFYSTKDRFGEFSNFSAHPFEIDGRLYPTSEHYFQAQKFADEAYCEQIRLSDSPMIAARLGRSRTVPIRDDWEAVKLDVMRRALRAKFDAYEPLRKLLLGTGDEPIIEAAKHDAFWGSGADGLGQNWLGRLLMELRDELRREER